MDEVNLSRHEDEFVEATVFKMDFSEPTEDVNMEKPSFLTNFANSGLFRGFARFDMTLRNRPAVFRILNQEDFEVLFIF